MSETEEFAKAIQESAKLGKFSAGTDLLMYALAFLFLLTTWKTYNIMVINVWDRDYMSMIA